MRYVKTGAAGFLAVLALLAAGCDGCTGDDPNDPPPPPPEAPSGLAATPLTSERIDLAWTDNATNEAEFRIERSSDGGAAWTEIARLPANSAAYADLGLAPRTVYSYRIRAVNSGGASAWAGPASATTRVRAWSSLPTGPSARFDHAAIYDPVGQRMIVFGGHTAGGTANDVWELTLPSLGSPTWNQLTPSGTPPSARGGHSAIYDPIGRQMIVFGGVDGSGTLPVTVHALRLDTNPVSWSTLSVSGSSPTGRSWHKAVYVPDPSTPRMIVFGGNNQGVSLSDVWELTLPSAGPSMWTQLSPSGSPGVRDLHVLVRDPVNGRLLTFGGSDGEAGLDPYTNETWALTLNPLQWTPLSVANPPFPRYGAASIFDPLNVRLTLFGGHDNTTTPMDNAVWVLGPSSWSAPAVSGPSPGGRYGHTAVYDELNRRMVIFGGLNESLTLLNDVWALDL